MRATPHHPVTARLRPSRIAQRRARGSSAEPKTRYYARNRSEGAKREEGHSGYAFRRYTLLPLEDCFHVLSAQRRGSQRI